MKAIKAFAPTLGALLVSSTISNAIDADYLALLFKERQHANPWAFGAVSLDRAKFSRASWYGGGERLNRHTANGEIFRPSALTAAHRSLPMGTRVAVSYGGRTVIVRINDRGPAKWTGRDLDLTREAARQLGYLQNGEARVTWRVVDGPKIMPGARVVASLADSDGWIARYTTSLTSR